MKQYLWFLWNFLSLAVDINIKFVPQRFEIRDYEKWATQTWPMAHPQHPLCVLSELTSQPPCSFIFTRITHWPFGGTFPIIKCKTLNFHRAKPALQFPLLQMIVLALTQLPAALLVSSFLFSSEAAVFQSFLPPRNPFHFVSLSAYNAVTQAHCLNQWIPCNGKSFPKPLYLANPHHLPRSSAGISPSIKPLLMRYCLSSLFWELTVPCPFHIPWMYKRHIINSYAVAYKTGENNVSLLEHYI